MESDRYSRTAGSLLRSWLAGVLMFAALPAHAASVTFYLNQSNSLPDDDYLSVTLEDNGLGGVKFLVQTLDPFNGIHGRNFGIQKFGFSFLDDAWGEISNLPDGWRVHSNRRMDGFGKFDIRLQGNGRNREEEQLSFTVDGVTLGDFGSLMAAQVAGFEWCDLDKWQRRNWCEGRNCTTSAFFAGTMPLVQPPSNVPLPAAAWMFGSGLIGLAAVMRRKNRSKPDYRELSASISLHQQV